MAFLGRLDDISAEVLPAGNASLLLQLALAHNGTKFIVFHQFLISTSSCEPRSCWALIGACSKNICEET